MSCKRPFVISVIGLIGAGKTYLINALIEELNRNNIPCVNLQEPVHLWTHPYNYLKETEERSTFKPISQGYVFATMMNSLLPYYNFDGVLVIERSVVNGIHEFSFDEMNPLVRHFYYELGRLERQLGVDLIIDVNTSIDTCLDRIAKRNRSGELENISTIEYLKTLSMRHNDFVNIIKYLSPEKLIQVDEDKVNVGDIVERIRNIVLIKK